MVIIYLHYIGTLPVNSAVSGVGSINKKIENFHERQTVDRILL